MNMMLVARMAWRDVRSGEMALLLVALLVAVGTVTSISLFVDRLQSALLEESSNFLAADRQISSSQAIPEAFVQQAQQRGLNTAQTLVFPSMVFAGDLNQLVSVKAVDATYPLRGELIVGSEPFQRGAPTDTVPEPGTVWLDSRLFPAMNLGLGDTIEVGMAQLTVASVLIAEPDRGGSFFDLGPRLLMNMQDVEATEVVQPGSRLSYRLLLSGAEVELEGLREDLPLKPNFNWVSVRESSPRIGRALDRAESFLLLGGLLGVLLAGIAVGLSAHRYAQRHFDHVGVLKTLGATPTQILRGFMSLLLMVGLAAIGLGLLLGSLLHVAIVEILATLIAVELPLPTARPFLLGAATGLICALAFAMPAFIHLKNVEPMRVIRRDLGVAPLSRWLSYGAAAGGSLLLLVWYTKDFWLTLWTLVSIVSICVVFGVLAWALLKGGRVAGMQAKSGWRLALAGLQRRRAENTAQILIFGVAIMLLLVMVLIRTALIDFDRLGLDSMDLDPAVRRQLVTLLDNRGNPETVLQDLGSVFGEQPVFAELGRVCDQIGAAAAEQGVTIQLDPTFQPHFELYTGLVFQLVCDGIAAPVVIARGGRYDELVRRCGAAEHMGYGAGFSLAIDPIRELINDTNPKATQEADILVAFSTATRLETAMARQRSWHEQGRVAVMALEPLESKEMAQQLANEKGSVQLDWIDP